MKNIIIVVMILIGCSKVSLINKNKEYEEVSLSINELILSAIHNNDLYLLEHYLSEIDNINLIIGERGTFLHAASEIGNLDIIKRLLELGADPLIKNSYGKYVYELSNNKEIIDTIADYTDSVNKKLALAINRNNTDEAIKLINAGANPNYIYNNNSTLELAINKKNLKLINELIERKVIINKKDLVKIYDISLDDFDYKLITNLIKNNYKLEEGLIDNKKYFLLLCSASSVLEVKDFIKRNHIEPRKISDKSFRNGLIIASFFNKLDLLKMLIEDYGLNINQKDENGFNSLFLSSSLGHLEIVRFIIEKGANINEENKKHVTPLVLASQNGHLEIVKLLLKNGANINSGNYYSSTPLMSASENGHLEIVELLIKKGAYINGKGESNFTPLILASQNGHIEIVELLIKKGAYINSGNSRGFTALILASENGHLEIVELLIKKGANVNDEINEEKDTSLMLASKNGHLEIVELLIKNGANIYHKNKKENTAFILASQNGHKEIVELLMKNGVNIHDINKKGNTSFILAVRNGHLEIVELLLKRGTNINIKNNMGETPLILASENGHLEVVELLLEKGVDFTVKDNYGFTAIMSSARNGHEKVFRNLLEKGANLNEKEKNDFTLLHLASIKGHKRLALFLIENGFNVNEKGVDDLTPLILASKNGNKETVELLLEKGANVNDKSDYGFTSLILASLNGHLEIVELLLEKGADFYAKANNGYTSLNVARQKGYEDIENLLLEKGANDIEENSTLLSISTGNKRYQELSIEEKLISNFKSKNILNVFSILNTYKGKINYNYSDKEKNSFLHYAASFNNIELFKEFLKKGCKINSKNILNETSLDIVLNWKNINENFILYLIKKGAVPNFDLSIRGIPLIEFLLPYNNLYNVLILDPFLKKFFKNINLSDSDKDNLKDIIKILKLTREDLVNENKKIMFKFIKDIIKFKHYKKIQSLKVCDISTLSIIDNSTDIDFNMDVFVSILSNFTMDDFEKSVRDEGIKSIKKRFIKRLKDVKRAVPISHLNKPRLPNNASEEELKNYEINMKKYNLECIKFTTKKQLYKLGLLISQASEKDKTNIKWAINIILEQLVCHVGTLEAINYAIKCLMQQDGNNDLKDALSNEIMQFRINLIEEVAKKHLHNKIPCISELGRGLGEYGNHMLAYLVMDLSKDLKVEGLYENEFKYEYDRDFVLNEVKRLYKERFIKEVVEIIKNDARLSNLVRDYLEKDIFKTSSYLMIEDFIHDDENKIKDNIIKILLLYFGYLK